MKEGKKVASDLGLVVAGIKDRLELVVTNLLYKRIGLHKQDTQEVPLLVTVLKDKGSRLKRIHASTSYARGVRYLRESTTGIMKLS